MFEQQDAPEGRVRPLKFRALGKEHAPDAAGRANGARGSRSNNSNSNDHDHSSQCQSNRPNGASMIEPNGAGALRRRSLPAARQNFSLEFAYPAVTLEDICFQVDRSQQQANFLRECIFRLNQALAPLCARSRADERGDEDGASQGRKVQILRGVNLSVARGSIFGLLGPSSCGKTTLLRCLLGLLKPTSGTIRLFGAQTAGPPDGRHNSAWWPGAGRGGTATVTATVTGASANPAAACQVPGSGVGYMPQDLGLYEDFTIAQLLGMFGRYMRMDGKLIAERIEFMASFLELPDVRRQVHTLSGGQKRRVSFAIACLHMPPLIILDEPTVGVDPLLRRSIWRYLRRLASEENRTIIITTHYIEEAAQADQVALMRAGRVLVQDTPGNIMRSNNSATLEEAFLKICNNVGDHAGRTRHEAGGDGAPRAGSKSSGAQLQPLAPPPPPPAPHASAETRFSSRCQLDDWQAELGKLARAKLAHKQADKALHACGAAAAPADPVIRELKWRVQEKLELYDKLASCRLQTYGAHERTDCALCCAGNSDAPAKFSSCDPFAITSGSGSGAADAADVHEHCRHQRASRGLHELLRDARLDCDADQAAGARRAAKRRKILPQKRNKFTLNEARDDNPKRAKRDIRAPDGSSVSRNKPRESWLARMRGHASLFGALLYKNYKRNANSVPLMAFQFMLPMIQMISFCLCVGGRPTNVGLGIVNHEQQQPQHRAQFSSLPELAANSSARNDSAHELDAELVLLSSRYLSFLDRSMLAPRDYEDLSSALADVRRSKLWAVVEIGQNFSSAIERRFDIENFYQLDADTIRQSVIRLYPDRSNKILDMICHRSLIDSFRAFLASEFDHFKRLPIEVARPVFEIAPNAISNSIDGYTESIAPGLLASLTYIMAAGLTTFIMVVERSDGILERTYTSGINPVAYLLAHALFRSLVMMVQIGLVLVLTFYVLKQPLVGSIWLAYAVLMVLNMTGIAYGLLISSIVTDQNGAALTIVSSLVVKITLSGILWPFEAIPYWLRTICYLQPLTMPVQALKGITLKGAGLGDASVDLGLLISITWLILFLSIAAKRFKFYQH